MNHSSYTPCYDDDTLLFNINLQQYEIAQFSTLCSRRAVKLSGVYGMVVVVWCLVGQCGCCVILMHFSSRRNFPNGKKWRDFFVDIFMCMRFNSVLQAE